MQSFYRKIVVSLIFLISILFTGSSGFAAYEGEIRVIVKGLKSDLGTVRYGLYDSKEIFAKRGLATRKDALPIINGECEFIIKNLPFGEYALVVGHDKNGNERIDSFFPMEPVGISNYKKRIKWFPNFDKAKFTLDSESKTIEIKLF